MHRESKPAQGPALGGRSMWRGFLLPLGFGCVAVIWYATFKLLMFLLHPGVPWEQLDSEANDGVLGLTIVPLFFPAICWGFLLANVLVWLVPPIRRSLGSAFGPDAFRKRALDLLRMGVILSLICWPISIFVASRLIV